MEDSVQLSWCSSGHAASARMELLACLVHTENAAWWLYCV
jgi:hypothetical protein